MSRVDSHKRNFDLWIWAMVFLIILVVGGIRARLLTMPLERDEGEYAYTGQLLLQGREGNFGWTIVIEAETGEMSVTLVNHIHAYVLYGNCTPL